MNESLQGLFPLDIKAHAAKFRTRKPPTSPYDARCTEIADRFRKWTGYRMRMSFLKRIIHDLDIEKAQAWIDRLESEEIHDKRGMPEEMRVGYLINRWREQRRNSIS